MKNTNTLPRNQQQNSLQTECLIMKSTNPLPDNRPRYPGICPHCGKELDICLSILQQDFGNYDLGFGSCIYCQKSLHLTFDPENKRFITEPWGDYLQKIERENSLQKEQQTFNI
jgi:hypothetical protein